MKKWVLSAALFGGISLLELPVIAQQPLLIEPTPAPSRHKGHKQPDKPLVQPNLTIPASPLGFAPPAAFYLGSRTSQVSLNFLDDSTLLFTFRVPGLIARDRSAPGESLGEERHIRAVVLALPDGRVKAESLWTMHDNARYLWMLKNNHFLLRDKNTVQMGDSSLHIEPFLRFPGPVTYLELDPQQNLLIANTLEPPAPDSKAETGMFPPTASASVVTGDKNAAESLQSLLRILSMDTRSVLLFSRVGGVTHLPLDGESYYEALRGNGRFWMITRQDLHGPSLPLTQVESICSPTLDAVAPGVVLISSCMDGGARRLAAVFKDKRLPWDISLPPTWVWPSVTVALNGRRIARSVLDVTHPVGPSNPLDLEDIRGQIVQVYDLASGKLQLTVPIRPILDGGGNFTLSPSGDRLAVLNAGAIQIYNLPPADPLP